MADKLSPRQQAFVHEYLKDRNAKQAAIRAGYAAGQSAEVQGHRLLSDVKVRAAIDALSQQHAAECGVTAERVISELARIAFADPRKVMAWGPDGVKLRASAELTDEEAALVGEVSETTSQTGGSLKIKTHSKVQALELLGKHLGMFVERRENTNLTLVPEALSDADLDTIIAEAAADAASAAAAAKAGGARGGAQAPAGKEPARKLPALH